MSRLPHACVLLLVQLIAGCARCGKATPSPAARTSIHRFLPRIAEAVVVVPNSAQLGAKLKQLESLKLASFVAQLQGLANAQEYVTGVVQQLGVDLRSRDELVKAGIDPERGAAVVVVSANRGYWVIAIADPGRFRDAVRRLANNRLGASLETTRDELGNAVTYFSRSGEAGSLLAFLVVDGFALMAAGESVQELPGYAALSLPESLADGQQLSAALARLPASLDIYVHVPTTSKLAGYCGFASCTLCAELTPTALQLRADLPRESTELALLSEKSGPELISFLPADAFLVARFNADPLLLSQSWPKLVGPGVAAEIQKSGFDVQGEVLENIEPGALASLSIAPTALLSEMPSLDFRRSNPFRLIHLVALAAVKDAGRTDQMLAKLPGLAPRLGAKIEPAKRQGRNAYLTSYAQGQGTHFAQVDGKLAIAAPVERLDQVITRLTRPADEGAGPIADAGLRQALKARALTVVLDFSALTQSIRNMPSSAWGIGGFAIKATTIRWLDAIDDLRAVTAGLYAKDGALEVEVDLRFAKR
ncbi:MAG TPA: hypothetical protein VN918_10405 [Myxococcaceae bacterium]|nr:hypothetical protein [Myxococcaceae bacterium]